MQKSRILQRLTNKSPLIAPPAAASNGSRPRRFETPHPKLPSCPPTASTLTRRRLHDEEILALNTYDFLAYLGKAVINPGGTVGRNLLLARLNPKPGSHVLEIGCGTGHTACHIARRFRCRVTAVDISPAMIAQARQTVQARGLGHIVKCEVADISALPFAQASFDYVVCQAVLMFVDQAPALQQLRRVLKPGGMFAGVEFGWRGTPPASVRQQTYDICGCRTLEFHHRGEWGYRLKQAGFDRVESKEQNFTMLSMTGFMRDEGLNSLKVLSRLLRRTASIKRLAGIWKHFSRHKNYFSYVVLAGRKLS
ncbi:MAG: methyltransferase domain-containing protein [Gammaproteobacteria bacterium]|nr:methyltransferase domain-containing protein [Gammaproteobacteria bacterium]